MIRRNYTALSDREWAERLVASFARAAAKSGSPFIAGWYARECIGIARDFLQSDEAKITTKRRK